MIEDLLKVPTVFVAVIQRNRDSLSSEASRTTYPVQVILGISNSLVALASPLRWHIEIYDNLDLGDIDTSGKQICCDNHTDLVLAELSDHLVTLLRAHVTENDSRLEILSAHHGVQAVCVGLGVDEDDSLGHLTYVEDLFEEFGLLSLRTSILKLLDVIEGELLRLEVNLLCYRSKLSNSGLHIFSVCCREKDVLHLLL